MKKAVYTTVLELESGGSLDNYHPVSVLAMRVLEKLPDYDRLAVKPIERSPHELAFDEILWDFAYQWCPHFSVANKIGAHVR